MNNKPYFIFFVLLAIANRYPLAAAELSGRAVLRVMTFNLWRTGTIVKDGPAKIIKHLNAINPCIVLFQECADKKFEKFLSDNNGWNVSYLGDNTAVATKYEIKSEQTYRIGTTLVVPIFVPALNLTVIVVNEHLSSWNDGAETLLINKNKKTVEERIQSAMSNEKELRLKEQMNVMADEKFQKMMADSKLAGRRQIIILGGDFNSPSHLDWGEDTKHKHDNIVFEWPVTKLLEQNGFVDSYRAVHKNASEEDGITWSPVVVFNEREPTYPEPQNRIDYLFYFDNGKVKAVNSKVYQGEKPVQKMPNHFNNDWPSDHRAVFTDFQLLIDKE